MLADIGPDPRPREATIYGAVLLGSQRSDRWGGHERTLHRIASTNGVHGPGRAKTVIPGTLPVSREDPMERKPRNDERNPEVDNTKRQGDGDESASTPDQKDASGTRGSGKSGGSRTAGTSGGERPESQGNGDPNRAASDKTS
jgi:hypothetical protein